MRRGWRREEIQESQGPRVQRSKGPMDPLKVKFKYELDSKEGLVFCQKFNRQGGCSKELGF